MRRAKPEGGNAQGALGPEKLAELKKEVSEAKQDHKLQRKASKATIDKGFVPEKVKPEVTLDEPSQAFLKRRAESTAARKYLDSLATPANPGAKSSQKKPAANTNRTRMAKAKARSKASTSKKVKSKTKKARCFGSMCFFQRLFRDPQVFDIMSTFFKTLIEWCMIVS